MKKNKNGFTLVEMMAVVSLIGVLMVLLVPVLWNVFAQAKNAIKDLDKKALTDGAKLYVNDLMNGNQSITYDDDDNRVVKKIKYNTGSREIDGYELIEYAAQNGLTVTARYLVENGYFDTNCDYNNPQAKCKVDPDCTIKITYEYTTVKANPSCNLGDQCKVYYTLGDYSASVLDEAKCVIK